MNRSSPEAAAARLRQALELHLAGIDLMRQNLKRRHPGLADDEIEELLTEWLRERPGAQHGDGDGRVVHEYPVRR